MEHTGSGATGIPCHCVHKVAAKYAFLLALHQPCPYPCWSTKSKCGETRQAVDQQSSGIVTKMIRGGETVCERVWGIQNCQARVVEPASQANDRLIVTCRIGRSSELAPSTTKNLLQNLRSSCHRVAPNPFLFIRDQHEQAIKCLL